MTRTVDDIIASLKVFEPTADGLDNVHRLYEVLEEFAGLPGNAGVMAALFELLERFPDADFGMPGPLAHALEAQHGFRPLLAESMARQPTELGTWLANRLLNTRLPRDERAIWLGRLTAVASHPRASQAVKESAIRFLDFQASRSGRQ